jgi:hypothetical protein
LLAGIPVFAIAMAYLESAVVVYLRRLYGISEITAALVRFDGQVMFIEAGRELATLLMLCAIAWVAGSSFQSRFGVFLLAFGLWDIFYYFWLRVFINWPATLLDTDLLFMLPLPWWGPILAPLLIAALMVIAGAGLVLHDMRGSLVKPNRFIWICLSAGILIDLYVFMADALALLPADVDALSKVQMSVFNWPVFLAGLALIVFAVERVLYRKWN